MIIIGGLVTGWAIGKGITLIGTLVYNMTTRKEHERKWADFMELYRRLRDESK